MNCKFCETNNEADAAFCKKCGSKLPSPADDSVEAGTFFEPATPAAKKPSLSTPLKVMISAIAVVVALVVGAVITNASNSTTVADDYNLEESLIEEPIVPVDWAPAGFEQYDDYLAYKFVTDEGEWPCDNCNFWKMKVTAHYGCPGGVYAELNMLDSADNVVEWSNDTVPALDAGQNAILVFENYPFDDSLASGQLTNLTCHS